MVKVWPEEYRRLLLQAAFAAVNQGLEEEVTRLIPVLPFVTSSRSEAALCHAFLLWGIGREPEALGLLDGRHDPDAGMLRRIITSERKNPTHGHRIG